MSLSDNIWNSLTGHNVHTIKVSAEQLAAVINDAFIKTASSTEELNRIEHTVKGSKVIFRRMDSEDGRFHLYVSYFERGLTQHRFAFVKNYETEEVFEWSGLNLGPLKQAVQPYLLQARMNPPFTFDAFSSSPFSDDTNENGYFNENFDTEDQQQIIGQNNQNIYHEKNIAINPGASADTLLQRAFSFLEDKDWEKADAYSEAALDLEPENAEAYTVKLMAEIHIRFLEESILQTVPLENSQLYEKALQYADTELALKLQKYNKKIKDSLVYTEATGLLATANSIPEVEKAQQLFRSISDYNDVSKKLEQCQKKISAISATLEEQYDMAINKMNSASTEAEFIMAGKKFKQILNYKDSHLLYDECLHNAKKCKNNEMIEQEKHEVRILWRSVAVFIAVIAVFFIVVVLLTNF